MSAPYNRVVAIGNLNMTEEMKFTFHFIFVNLSTHIFTPIIAQPLLHMFLSQFHRSWYVVSLGLLFHEHVQSSPQLYTHEGPLPPPPRTYIQTSRAFFLGTFQSFQLLWTLMPASWAKQNYNALLNFMSSGRELNYCGTHLMLPSARDCILVLFFFHCPNTIFTSHILSSFLIIYRA